MYPFLFFLCIVFFEVIALYSVKKYSQTKEWGYLATSILCYGLIPVFLYLIIKQGENVSTVNIIWNILSTIYGLVIGMLIFQEKIHSLQIYGVILGVLGLGLILWKPKVK